MKEIILLCGCLLMVHIYPAVSWGSNKDRVLLKEISSITLEAGKMTNGQRSSPVPQLKCVGGSAGRSAPQPQVVQCMNRGSDGYDVQWECKADMDYDYRFGKLQVSCEGYDYPDDPYVLRGSCGLEYEIDYTEQGRNRQHQGGGGGAGFYDNYHGSYGGSHNFDNSGGLRWGKIISLVIMGAVAYWVYKSCCSSGRRYSPTSSTSYSSSGMGSGSMGSGGMGSGGMGSGGMGSGNLGGGGGGGFWTGAATGGLLGYMFGNRGTGYGSGYGGGWGRGYGPSWGGGYTSRSSGWGSGGGWGSRGGWGSGGGGWSSSRSSRSSSSSRSTSGFGGTSRR